MSLHRYPDLSCSDDQLGWGAGADTRENPGGRHVGFDIVRPSVSIFRR